MTRGRAGRVAGLWLACLLVSACNEADVIARPEVVANIPTVDAGLDCNLSAQLSRHGLPAGISNVFLPDCEWPVSQSDSVDDLRLLVNIGIRSDTKEHVCAVDPFHVWPEPPPPLSPQKLVFCPGSCKWVRDWLACRLRNDPCREGLEEDDGGVNGYCP